MKLVIVAGARPNFMKIAPIMWEIERRCDINATLVHTGQHYDERMSKLFFEQLNIPRPDVDLEVGSGSQAIQTAEVMKRFEPVLAAQAADATLVVGDVNSTIACALTSVKLGIPVAHVEAGLRSHDRSMPEEINRILTDAISRWLFVSESSGIENLRREGVDAERIFFVGNVMIDTLIACREKIQAVKLDAWNIPRGDYGVLTLHRPSNVDDPATLAKLIQGLQRIQAEIPIVFPVHPRTRKTLGSLAPHLDNLILTEPLGYLEFMKLVSNAKLVMTDSGGIQEETTYLGVPCITLRNNTERPSTLTHGTNILVGQDPATLVNVAQRTLREGARPSRIPPLWDGQAAVRVLDVLERTCGNQVKQDKFCGTGKHDAVLAATGSRPVR
jgi:UDP-N-acetylglucosamine 2-epimerase (non-hydrolysing)